MSHLKTILFVFICFFLNFQITNANENFAFLNIDLVFQNTIAGKNITKKLEDYKKKNLQILKSKEADILKKEKELLSQKNILSNEEYEKKIKALKKEINNFNLDKNKISNEFEQKKNDELKLFMQKIRPVIQEYTIKNSVSMVFNQKNLFIADKKYDITNQIIELIDKKLKNE
tara:strand:- start:295 stop:813 length:519 start_codon:yes stop_codon:yes gene_type:complete